MSDMVLGEELRLLYHLDAPDRRPSTAAWLRWASRSKLRPFVKLGYSQDTAETANSAVGRR